MGMEIIIQIISPLCWVLAAICSSCMDTVDHHFPVSVFSKIKSKKWRIFFNESQGWLNKYNGRDPAKGRRVWKWRGGGIIDVPVVFTDSWHAFKGLEILLAALSILSFPYTFKICLFDYEVLNGLVWLCILGLLWNKSFVLFYNRILILRRFR